MSGTTSNLHALLIDGIQAVNEHGHKVFVTDEGDPVILEEREDILSNSITAVLQSVNANSISKSSQDLLQENGQVVKPKVRNWNDDNLKVFARVMVDNYDEFCKPATKRSGNLARFFENIRKLFMKALDVSIGNCVNFTDAEVQRKWYYLIDYYKKIKDKHNSTGEGRQNLPQYFHIIDEKLGTRNNISPPQEWIRSSRIPGVQAKIGELSSTPSSDSFFEDENDENNELNLDAGSTPISRSKKRRQRDVMNVSSRKRDNSMPAWFQSYVKEREAKEDQRWNEMKEIMKQRNDVAGEMVSVLRELATKK